MAKEPSLLPSSLTNSASPSFSPHARRKLIPLEVGFDSETSHRQHHQHGHSDTFSGTPDPWTTEYDLRSQFGQEKSQNIKITERTRLVAEHLRNDVVGSSRWWKSLLLRKIPIITTIRNYRRAYLSGDLLGGLSVGVSAIPMGMSYSLLAGLPPKNGLYNNLFFPLIYMIFGTSQEACIGTSAAEAMVSAQAVNVLVGDGASPDGYLNGTIGMTLTVGILLILYNLLGLAVIASFLADSVMSGFSTAAAFMIGTSQLKDLFGITIPRSASFQTWIHLIGHIHQTHLPTLLVGVVGLGMLMLFRWISNRWIRKCPLPGPLILIVIFALGSYLLRADQPPIGLKIIGNIPRGLPVPRVFHPTDINFGQLVVQAICYSIIFLVVHVSVAKVMAQQRGYTLDVNQDLLALGLACISGSFFQCFPIATSVSRTSIARVIGVETSLFNVANCLVVLLVVTLLTPALHYLPMATLASVVMFGVLSMLDFREGWRLLRLMSLDFLLWACAFCITIVWGPMEGVACSVALSILWLLKKNAFPRVVVLGRLPRSRVFRDVERFPMAQQIEGCKIMRFDASLNFANAEHFGVKVRKLVGLTTDPTRGEETPPFLKEGKQSATEEVRVVIIDASSINDVDVTAVRMLKTLVLDLRAAGIVMLFANWKGPMRDFLDRVGFYDLVPTEQCFLSLNDAVSWAEACHLMTLKSGVPTPVPGSKGVTSGHLQRDKTLAEDPSLTIIPTAMTSETLSEVGGPFDSPKEGLTMRHVTEKGQGDKERTWAIVVEPPAPTRPAIVGGAGVLSGGGGGVSGGESPPGLGTIHHTTTMV